MRALFAIACVVAGATACTLLTSLDDYAGTAPVTDGGDSATETGAADAFVQADAGPPWCSVNAPDADFCADFETKDLSQFDRLEQTKSTVTRDLNADAATSPPYAVLFDVPEDVVDGGAGARASIVHATGSSVTDVNVAFDFRLDKVPAVGRDAQILKIVQRGGGTPWEIGITIDPDNRKPSVYTFNNDNAYTEPYVADNPLVIGQWVRFELHFRVTGLLQGNFDFGIDGKRLASAVGIFPGYPLAPVETLAGVTYVSTPHGAWVARVDNFVFDSK